MSRYTGLEQVVFEGVESLPSSKFNIILDMLKDRIANEQMTYSEDELRESVALVRLADSLRLLFMSQDTPLYSTQNSLGVNELADELVLRGQKPLTIDELPPTERETYQKLYLEFYEEQSKRWQLWSEYATMESFNRSVAYADRYAATCPLGMGGRTRRNLENLARFNRLISERFNLMRTHIGDDNAYKVNYLLDYVPRLEEVYEEMYPEEARRRGGNYERVYSEESDNIRERNKVKLSNIVNFLDALKR